MIGSPEVSAIQMSHPIVKCNLGVIHVDTNLPENRVRFFRPLKEITEETDDSEEIYEKAAREHYMSRPRTDEYEKITFPKYISEYNHTMPKNVPKYAVHNQHETLDNMVVYKRAKPLIPHTHFLTVLDGENFYYQRLLWCIPFCDDKAFVTSDNVTKTYKEECYIRGIFDKEDDIDVSFKEMKERNFDPLQISKIARKMLIQEIALLGSLKRKIADLDYGEVIPLDEDDNNLVQYQTVSLGDYCDNETDKEIRKLLNINRQKLIHETKDLKTRISKLTNDQKKVFNHIEANIGKQKLLFITGSGGVGKSYLLHTIVHFLEFSGEIVQVTATSGSAAKLIYGQTLHSFLSLDCDLKAAINYQDQTWRSIASPDTIICDEASMLSAEILENLNEICTACVEGDNQAKPFGGKNILLFGDLYQLPSVTTKITPRYIYQSSLWSKFIPFILTQNCRQTDANFINLLERVRVGEHTEDDIKLLEGRVCNLGHELSPECTDYSSPGVMVICSKIAMKNEINEDIMEKTLAHQPLHQLKGTDYEEGGR